MMLCVVHNANTCCQGYTQDVRNYVGSQLVSLVFPNYLAIDSTSCIEQMTLSPMLVLKLPTYD